MKKMLYNLSKCMTKPKLANKCVNSFLASHIDFCVISFIFQATNQRQLVLFINRVIWGAFSSEDQDKLP